MGERMGAEFLNFLVK